MHRRTPLFSLLSLVLLAAPLTAAPPVDNFFFKKGDRVVFLGDSITEQFQYSTDIELYLTTRFPDVAMTFLNAGIGGDTATGGAGRFADHVLAEKPTVVTIDFGMNDGGYGGFNPEAAKQYAAKTEAMLQAAQKAGVRVVLISPNAVEVAARPDAKHLPIYLETQKQFYAPLRELAQKYNVPFVDQYAVTRRVLEKIAADGSPVHPFPDAVHTNGAGGLLMAHTILTGLKAPARVSNADIDAAARKAHPVDCTVEELNVTSDGVSFRRKDRALPLAIPPDWRPLLPYVNELKDLNYYGLKVTGLAGGKYELSIDGVKVADYTAEELGKGVNLGNLSSGPLYDQGKKVFDLINAKNGVVHDRFRGVIMFNAPHWFTDKMKEEVTERRPVARREMMEKIQAMQDEVYKAARPKEHRFELKAVK